MKQKILSRSILALCIIFSLVSCNNNEKKAEESSMADTTATAPEVAPAPPATEESIDAVKAAPNLYKVLSDSLGIRILEATYKPGDSSVLHSHPDNAVYVISGGTDDFIGKDGTKTPMEMKTGMTSIRGYDLHSVKNTGKTTLKVIVVEVNRPKTIVPTDPATDPTKVAANNYKTLADSLGIRIVEVNYKPGQSSVFHTHSDVAVYAVQGGTGELTGKDGKKNVSTFPSGATWIAAADGHSGKNIGKKPYKLILFEINRPRN